MPTAWNAADAQILIDDMAGKEGALLPILHALQERFGHVPSDAIALIASSLNLSRAEVYGVVSFYHDFRDQPPPALVVKVCRAEACQAAGGREAAKTLLDDLGLDWNQPGHDVVVEPVFCLGLCAVAPAALLGAQLIARFDGPGLAAAVRAAR